MYRKTSSINRHIFWLLGMVLLLLTSCDYTFLRYRIGDGGLLSGKPCPAPCFWEIRPGETTKAQAIEILRGKGAFSYNQLNNYVYFFNGISFESDSNGTIDRIGFVPSIAITVEALIAQYGSPDEIQVIYGSTTTPEHNNFAAGLYYNDMHAYFGLIGMQDTWPPVYIVHQDSRITYIYYFSESYYETWKASDTHHISQWTGYGTYPDSP